MNDDQLNDLKQFITTTVTTAAEKSEVRIKDDIRGDIDQKINGLRDDMGKKIDSLQHQMDSLREDLVTGMNQQTDVILTHINETTNELRSITRDHEQRIIRLEHRTA